MRIERISDNTIKAYISQEELKSWNVSVRNFAEKTPEAQKLFWHVVREAQRSVDFPTEHSQLLVEATGSDTGGFEMTISRLPLAKKGKIEEFKTDTIEENKARVYQFVDFENICLAFAKVGQRYKGQSSVYKLENKYFLILYPENRNIFDGIEHIILEYGKKCINDISVELIKERGNQLISNDAVEIILQHFR